MLRECLEVIPASVGELRYEIIVVDNNSTDGSVEMVREFFPKIKLLVNQSNLGFPKAVNQGIRESTGEFLALVNSDIILAAGQLEGLAKHLISHEHVGAAGPQLISPGGHFQYSGGYAPSVKTALNQFIGIQLLVGARTRSVFVRLKTSEPLSVDWICGACVLIRSAAVKQTGYFDEAHFMYAEDVDYSLRLKANGWKLYLLPEYRVVHLGGGSSNSEGSRIKLMWLGGIFRIAAQTLTNKEYILFGIFMSLSFWIRYTLITMMNLLKIRKLLEVADKKDLINYGSAAFRLAFKGRGYATTFCQELEIEGYPSMRNESLNNES